MTSNETCVTGSPAVSNTLAMTVHPVNPVSVTISASSNPACQGSTVTFTATPVNGGSAPAFQWQINSGNVVGATDATYLYQPANGELITCRMTSNVSCPQGNPAISLPLTMTVYPLTVSYSTCHDIVTTPFAKPFQLKGGLPLGGTYSGSGVVPGTDIFDPALAVIGNNIITYSYTTADLCTDTAHVTIVNQASTPVDCSNPFMTDIRDNKVYPIVQIGGQCWMAANLNYGTRGNMPNPQSDNCLVEKYCLNDQESNCNSYGAFYQWDELMRYEPGFPGRQGICPPGWHVPTNDEWEVLFDHYGGRSLAADSLKILSTGHFRALTEGLMYGNKQWSFTSPAISAAMFWTSDPAGVARASAFGMTNRTGSVSDYKSGRENGFVVRCLRD